MKNPLLASCLMVLLPFYSFSQLKFNLEAFSKDKSEAPVVNESYFVNHSIQDTGDIGLTLDFKPSVQVGGLMHAFASLSQAEHEGSWQRNFVLYRARVLLGATLSRKGTFFMETDIPSGIGAGAGVFPKNMKVSPIILDFQYEHVFSRYFSIIAGKQLVSNNRNGLQGAASLMANDFTHYQYPYNLFETDPLQGNFGRDIGINTRGFIIDRLEYRLGAFTGRRFDPYGPLRVVGRLQYSFLDPEKDFYYAGTKLGAGETFTLAGGVDAQADYINLNVDTYLDVPVGPGSITLNAAYAYLDGGSDPEAGPYTFYSLIPKQTIQFLELGYYFKDLKLQPWIKYENQNINEDAEYYGLAAGTAGDVVDDLNFIRSNIRFGGGLNYWFNGYNANLRLSYTQAYFGGLNDAGTEVERKSVGQLWLQLQVFFF